MEYYNGFVFYLDENNSKWKEYYDSLGKKSFGVYSVAQYFTKKLKELADDKLDKVLNIESSYINQLADNSLHLSEKAISNWKDIYSDLLQQGDVCVIAIPGYLWKGTPQTSYSFMTKVARKEVTLSDVLTIPEYAELVEKLFILRFGKKPQDCTTDTVEFFIPALQCATSEHFVASDSEDKTQAKKENTLQAPAQPVVEAPKTCRCDKDLTVEDIKFLFNASSDVNLKSFINAFNEFYKSFNLTTCLRRAHFFAQVRKEIGNDLSIKRENMNYRADVLKSGDPFTYFLNHQDEAELYGRVDGKGGHKANQEAIANRVYANKYGNGNIESGDGWRYRGGGILQVTFKDQYEEINTTIKKVHPAFKTKITPENISNIREAVISAMAYWYNHNLNAKADAGNTESAVDTITSVINKKTDSYAERKQYFKKIKNKWIDKKCAVLHK